jgi:hypothetical protein
MNPTGHEGDRDMTAAPLGSCSTCHRPFCSGDVAVADLFDGLHCSRCAGGDDWAFDDTFGGAV